MYEFLSWAWPARLGVTILLALCVLAQTLALVLSWYSRRRLVSLLELCQLALILFGSLLYGQMLGSFETGLIAPLPLKEPVWAWIFLASMLFWLVRGIVLSLLRYREVTTSISALSIKNAIDSLHTGVLFGEPDGYILLSNAQMQRLMTLTAGKVYRNGSAFYELLASGELRPGCRKAEFEGQIVCLLPDDSAWMFSRTQLRIGRKTYIQLTAADITQRWELTMQLQRQNSQLQRRSEELKETIASLHMLSRERETQKAKMRAHDILGQRMSLLLRGLRMRTVHNEQTLDYGLLRAMPQGLLDELKAGYSAPAQDFLDSLRHEFARVGVDIRLQGISEDCVKGQLFADIVREGVANAVRHGFATEIVIESERIDGGCRMRITNNGPPPPENFTEGGGLTGMRRKLEPRGGALRVISSPRFVLEITIPGGDDDA